MVFCFAFGSTPKRARFPPLTKTWAPVVVRRWRDHGYRMALCLQYLRKPRPSPLGNTVFWSPVLSNNQHLHLLAPSCFNSRTTPLPKSIGAINSKSNYLTLPQIHTNGE